MAFTLEIGETAPHFALSGVDGKVHWPHEASDANVLIVVFICNHCPFVIGSIERTVSLYHRFAPRGVTMLAINSNESDVHTTDAFPFMIEFARKHQLPFPYLHDETQEIALAYGALRTPHFFVFGRDRRLLYTGRLDDSPKFPEKATTHELADVLEAILCEEPVPVQKTNPIGCTVKWRNRDPHWMPPEACDLVP